MNRERFEKKNKMVEIHSRLPDSIQKSFKILEKIYTKAQLNFFLRAQTPHNG